MTVPSGIETKRYPAKKIGETALAWKASIFDHEVDLPKSVAWWNNRWTQIYVSTFFAKKKKLDELTPPQSIVLVQMQPERRWSELSTVLKSLPERGALSNPDISRLTGIVVGNLTRSRIKLWDLGLATTDNFKTIYLTAKGRSLQGQYIYYDNKKFASANKRWTAAKKRYNRQLQRGFFDDAE